MEYNTKNHYVYSCKYHIIFCPKYRSKILKDDIAIDLHEIIENECFKKDINILEMEIMPDHVHLLLDCPLDNGPLQIIKSIKQQSAVLLKRKHPSIKTRLPNLWTRSAFISTVGSTSLEAVNEYIKNQKGK
ncbi:MAG: IS200/IS605 family transposase [Longicatena sp.]